MGAKKGNKNSIGNKGGGRKSAYEELAIAERIVEAFTKGIDKKKLTAALKSDKVNLTDYSLVRALKSDAVLMGLLKKLLPDKIEDNGKKEVDFSREAYKRIGKYIREKK